MGRRQGVRLAVKTILTTVAIGALALPAGAWAATPGKAAIVNGVLTFQAGANTSNSVVVDRYETKFGVHYAVTDAGSGASIVPGAGCFSTEPTTALCAISGTRAISLSLGNLNDDGIVPYYLRLPARILGGTGNDRLTGGGGADVLLDVSGADMFQGGAGNDQIVTRDGRKDLLIDCSSGRDLLVADRIDVPTPGCETVRR